MLNFYGQSRTDRPLVLRNAELGDYCITLPYFCSHNSNNVSFCIEVIREFAASFYSIGIYGSLPSIQGGLGGGWGDL